MNETNEIDDPFEAELRALRPHEPSGRLRKGIADRLSRNGWPRLAPRSVVRLAVAGSLIAACLLAAIFLPRINAPVTKLQAPVTTLQPNPSVAFDATLPSLWWYHTALARSSESLDALLDQHSALTREPEPERARVFVFTRSQTELDDLLGEL